MPFTAASTAALRRGVKIRCDWLTEKNPARGIDLGDRILEKRFLIEP